MASERSELLRKVQQVCFALDDVILFLDTHPTDAKALEYYEKMKNMKNDYMKEFTYKYGPLSSNDVNVKNRWTWIDNPWPWEMEANS